MKELKPAPPWVIAYRMMTALFCTSAVGGLQGAEFDKPLGEWP